MDETESLEITWRKMSEWVGLLGAPTLWLIELNVVYWLVPVACEARQPMMITLVSLFFLVVTVGLGVLAWRNWLRVGKEWPSIEEGSVVQRSRFMSVLGLMSSALFGLFIMGDMIPPFIVNPCFA